MRIVIRRSNLPEMIAACQEKESQGYECVRKITPIKKEFKDYKRSRNKHEFAGTFETMKYQAIYEKVN